MPTSHQPSTHQNDEPAGWPDEVTIGIITALPIEGAAVLSLVDSAIGFRDPHDQNDYDVGRMPSSDPDRPHTVAVLTMPRDGTRLAATCCTNMLRTFPNIKTVVMAGVAGGIPHPRNARRHVRLGDVVVATEGIIDYDHVRETDTGPVPRGRQSGGLVAPRLVQSANRLQVAEQRANVRPWEFWLDPARYEQAGRFPRPPVDSDVLREDHRVAPHPPLPIPGPAAGMPRIHYGAIGSADILLKAERRRDALSNLYPDMIAVEMEGSGIAASTAANERTWFMVRGIADYAAADKNDLWHGYASYAAAAYLRALLGATPPLSAPKDRVTGRALPLIPKAEQEALDRLLTGAPSDADLRAVWRAAVPDLPEPEPIVFSTPADVYHHLARLNGRFGKSHPAFVFIDRLGRTLADGPIGAGLMAWAARQIGFATTPGEPEATEPTSARAGTFRPALVLQITVDGIDHNQCRITPYLQAASGPWRPVPFPTGPVDVRVTGIEAATAKLVAKAEELWQHTADRAGIEFVLPASLLNLAVQWFDGPQILDGSQPLCVQYEVAVRSLDRMRERRARRVWAHRWQQLDRQPFAGRVLWGGPGTLDDLRRWAAELTGDDSFLVVVLSAPPDTPQGREELRAALRAGVPIVLWDQRLPRPEDGTQGLLRLTAEPAALPENTRRVRIVAEQAPDTAPAAFGRAVALLWDDADRLISEAGAGS